MGCEHLYDVYGTVTIPVRMTIKAKSHEEAIILSNLHLNRYNVVSRVIELETPLNTYSLGVTDVDNIEWTSAFNEEDD